MYYLQLIEVPANYIKLIENLVNFTKPILFKMTENPVQYLKRLKLASVILLNLKSQNKVEHFNIFKVNENSVHKRNHRTNIFCKLIYT
jgi:hypothetical protein